MDLDFPHAIAALIIGLVAGVVGGLAGIGGSIIMLPALALWFGYTTPDRAEHHLYMASAMCVNAVVAWSSSRKHAQKGAVDKDVVRVLLPAMAVMVVAGVLVSNQFDGKVAKLALVVFILGYCVYTLWTAVRKLPEPTEDAPRASTPVLGAIAAGTGFAAGFLGIGGGIVLVPQLQIIGRIPIRRAIAASASVMWVTAIIGASLKLATLGTHGQDWVGALSLAAFMAAGAYGGARFGAVLTHALPLTALKVAIALILAVAAVRMAAQGVDELGLGTPESVDAPIDAETPPSGDPEG